MAPVLKIKNAVHVAAFIPNRLYLVTTDNISMITDCGDLDVFSTDDNFDYAAYFEDFGPLNLGLLHYYCMCVQRKLRDPSLAYKKILHCTTSAPEKRANAAFLMASFAVIYLNMSPDQADNILQTFNQHYRPFRDAAPAPVTFEVTILDCLQSIQKAVQMQFIDFDTFDPQNYDHYKLADNGNMNWIIPDKILAFTGPQYSELSGYSPPELYVDYFKKVHVTDVVRLNSPMYNPTIFTNERMKHHDLYFVDGTAPSKHLVKCFISIVRKSKGPVAVHCRAGLGRTGTLIACYLMYAYKFTAKESIAWLRICRPGSVIGVQQHFLQYIEEELLMD